MFKGLVTKGLVTIGMACIALLLVGGNIACAEPPSPAAYGSVKEKVTELIQAEMKKTNTMGLSIALVDDQQIVWAQGFGYQDKENNVPATADTVYQVGSITKLFTVMAAMQLAEQGKIDIDQPLQQYLPQFSMKSRFPGCQPITPRTIMTHHSGIPCDYVKDFYSAQPYTDLVADLHNEYVAYPPNFIFAYSNAAMTLLGHAVAKVSGSSYPDYIRDKLLNPLGMQHAFIANIPSADNPLMSKCYSKGKEDKLYPLRDIPAGGLCANVNDMARFIEMIFARGTVNGQKVLKPTTIAETLQVQNANIPLDFDFHIGLGWILSGVQIPGYAGNIAFHDGAINDFFSVMIILPDCKLGVVVLANSQESLGIGNEIATKTLALALAAKAPGSYPKRDSNLKSTIAKCPDLHNYTGYYATMGILSQLVAKNDSFFVKIGDASLRLVCNTDDSFSPQVRALGFINLTPAQLKDAKLFFTTIDSRDVVLLQQNNGPKMILSEKISPVPLPAGWEKLTGIYELANPLALPANLRDKIIITIQDGFLTWASQKNANAQLVILPVSATEGIIAGLGRGLGETITFKTVDGQQYAVYSGLEYKKITPTLK